MASCKLILLWSIQICLPSWAEGSASWGVHCRTVHWQDVPGRADVPSLQNLSKWILAICCVQRADLQRPDRVHPMCNDGVMPEFDTLLFGWTVRPRGGGQVQAVRSTM